MLAYFLAHGAFPVPPAACDPTVYAVVGLVVGLVAGVLATCYLAGRGPRPRP